MPESHKRLVALSPVQWTQQIERWTANKIRQNLWRFDPIYDFEDIMQEAKLLFWKVQRYYPLVDEPANLFSLYKITLNNFIIDNARKRRTTIDTVNVEKDEQLHHGTDFNMGILALIVEEMPQELKTVLKALTTGRVRLMVDRPTKKPQLRENLNSQLKRKFQLTLADPIGELKSYLLNA